MTHIWKYLELDKKYWRSILKTIALMEYLAKLGANRCTDSFRTNIYKLRKFQNFSHYVDGKD